MKKKLFFNFFLSVLIFTLWTPFVLAGDLSSTNFIVRDPVVGTGGGFGSSGTFQLFNSLDESVIGAASSSTFLGHYGFLYFPPLATPVTTSEAASRSASSGLLTSCRVADFNCDTYVDIFDLSILLYYVDQTGPTVNPFDLSKDSEVGFTDISIVFYYWDTGGTI